MTGRAGTSMDGHELPATTVRCPETQ